VAVVTKKDQKSRGSFITFDRCCDNHGQRKRRGAKFPSVAGMTKRNKKKGGTKLLLMASVTKKTIDFWFWIGSFVIISMNKDYAYILLTYVLLPISCVDFC